MTQMHTGSGFPVSFSHPPFVHLPIPTTINASPWILSFSFLSVPLFLTLPRPSCSPLQLASQTCRCLRDVDHTLCPLSARGFTYSSFQLSPSFSCPLSCDTSRLWS